ncbi:MAG: DUF368 domain-containing protein [Lachnospiraceae bacterium]
MNYIKEICKGVLIGVAQIAPGVSGGTLAIAMGIYDKLIGSVSHFFREPVKSIKTLLPYVIGACLGVVALSFAIEFLFEVYPLGTSLTFIGLILGGVPSLLSKIPLKRVKAREFGVFFLVFLLFLGMAALEGRTEGREAASALASGGLISYAAMAMVGVISAATMVVPGVSGTMILMMIGYYQPLLACINRTMVAAAGLDIPGVLAEFPILVPFGIGLLAGVFLCAKLIEYLLARWERMTYCGILGLVLSSPFVILWTLPRGSLRWGELFIGMLCFCVSYLFVARMEK